MASGTADFIISPLSRKNPLPEAGDQPLYAPHLLPPKVEPKMKDGGPILPVFPKPSVADVRKAHQRVVRYIHLIYRIGKMTAEERDAALERVEIGFAESIMGLDPSSAEGSEADPENQYYLPSSFGPAFGRHERFIRRLTKQIDRSRPNASADEKSALLKERIANGYAEVRIDDVVEIVDQNWHPTESSARRGRFHRVKRRWPGIALRSLKYLGHTAIIGFFVGTFSQAFSGLLKKEVSWFLAEVDRTSFSKGQGGRLKPAEIASLYNLFEKKNGVINWQELDARDDIPFLSNFVIDIQLALHNAKHGLQDTELVADLLTSLYVTERLYRLDVLKNPLASHLKKSIEKLWQVYDHDGNLRKEIESSYAKRVLHQER